MAFGKNMQTSPFPQAGNGTQNFLVKGMTVWTTAPPSFKIIEPKSLNITDGVMHKILIA